MANDNEKLRLEYDDLQEKLKELGSDLEKRDKLYLEIAQENDKDFDETRKQYFIEKIKPLVEKRAKAGEYLNKMYQTNESLFNMIEKLNTQYEEDTLNTVNMIKKLELKKKMEDDKINLLEREHQILKYRIYISDETIHLLYIMSIIMVVCCLVVLLNYFKIVDKIIVSFLLLTIIMFFVLYVVKVIVIDRVNINTYFYRKIDFNKPKEDEILTQPEEDEEDSKYYEILRTESKGDGCKKQIERGTKIEDAKDEILDKVKSNIVISMGNEKDSDRCLITR